MIFLVTGCLGFIGRHFVDLALANGHYVIGVDAETYASDTSLIKWWSTTQPAKFKYIKADICELDHISDVDAIVNFAAETHVDNSIMDSTKFVKTNFLGVQRLLELVRSKRNYEMPRFIQISTDEVYGDIGFMDSPSMETDPLKPSSPYSASKAAADLLIQSYARTYKINYNIIRPSNCYGPHQYPEKLIPKTIRHLALNKPIPVHGEGDQIRSWLHVEDAADAILHIIDKGLNGSIYNISGESYTVLEIIQFIVELTMGDKTTNPISINDYCRFNFERP